MLNLTYCNDKLLTYRCVNFLLIDINVTRSKSYCILITLIPCMAVNQCLRQNLGYKQKIQVIRCNQVYFSSSNVSADTTVIVKD